MAMALLTLRMFAYAVIPAAWWVLPIALLHGVTFAAMWSAGVSLADELAPEGLGATAQGIFSGVVFGVGAATGALLGGLLFESVGPERTFQTGGTIVLVGLIFYALIGRGGDSGEAEVPGT